MISGLKIGNFKAFSETQHIPIRPLTLIFGPNSSGKSSLIHSLILANQGMKKGDLDVHRTEIGGESVDLGGFKQYVFKRDAGRQVDWEVELDATRFEGRMSELFKSARKVTIAITIGMFLKKGFLKDVDESLLQTIVDMEDLQVSDLLKEIQKGQEDKQANSGHSEIEKYEYQSITVKEYLEMKKEPQVMSYEIKADGISLLTMSIRRGGFLRLDIVNNEHPVMKSLIKAIMQSSTTTDQITPEDYDLLDTAISELVLKISAEVSKFLPYGIKDISKDTDELLTISKGRRQEDLLSAFNLIFPRLINEIIGGLTQIVEGQLQRLRYLGPLRSYPPRHLAFSQYHDPNWQAGGGSAWEEVRKDPELRKKINEWLGDINKLSTPYELIVRHLLTIDDLEKHYSKRVDKIEETHLEERRDDFVNAIDNIFDQIYNIPKELMKIERNIAEIGELVLEDKRTGTTVSHRDVGIGISQVLPVLVSAYANKNALIAIEQPEIHLHPALQAELGDVFIESALGKNKNSFILETHSEHLILRLLRRIRETTNRELQEGLLPLKPDDIAIIYAKPGAKGITLIDLRVTEDGEFADKWPDGFFTERAKELF